MFFFRFSFKNITMFLIENGCCLSNLDRTMIKMFGVHVCWLVSLIFSGHWGQSFFLVLFRKSRISFKIQEEVRERRATLHTKIYWFLLVIDSNYKIFLIYYLRSLLLNDDSFKTHFVWGIPTAFGTCIYQNVPKFNWCRFSVHFEFQGWDYTWKNLDFTN